MRKPFRSDKGKEAEPLTVPATLVWNHPDRLVAMCAGGVLYHWLIKRPSDLKEGALVFVTFNQVSGEVFSVIQQGDSSASEDI